jgi:AcrR family transcriptional regulator
MGKGELTRQTIVDQALVMASQNGLDGITIGSLATRLERSKSGVFAHFGSREELQLAVLQEGARRFVAEVMEPALAKPRGLPRIMGIVDNWFEWTHQRGRPGGCIFMAGALEFDDRPGAVRDAIAQMQQQWREMVERAVRQAIEVGDFRPDTDAGQFSFECYAIVLALHHDIRLFSRSRDTLARARTALDRLIASCSPAPRRRASGDGAGKAPPPARKALVTPGKRAVRPKSATTGK